MLRYKDGGFKPPRIIYTDLCCTDRTLIVEVFEELREEGIDFAVENAVAAPPALPDFTLSPSVNVVCVRAGAHSQTTRSLCDKLRSEAAASNGKMGMDIEWDVSFCGAPPNPPAMIQLAAGDCVVIFRLVVGASKAPKVLPPSLARLLGDSTVMKTGVGIAGDCSRLQRFYQVQVRNAVDLVQLAASRKVPLGRRRGLAALCSELLGLNLCKDEHIRCSKWSQPHLTEEQKGCVPCKRRHFSSVFCRNLNHPEMRCFFAWRRILPRGFVTDTKLFLYYVTTC